MRQVHDQQYSQFTPNERLNLTISALSRGDEAEANRLWQTCPRHKYDAHDFEYTLGVNALMMLSAIFFERCVFHYNLIKRADLFIVSSEQDLEFEKQECMVDLSVQTQRAIDLANKAQNVHISKLKALFEGFQVFCTAVGLDGESILKTIPIKDSCHDIDILLATDGEVNKEYVDHFKSFFLEHWHF